MLFILSLLFFLSLEASASPTPFQENLSWGISLTKTPRNFSFYDGQGGQYNLAFAGRERFLLISGKGLQALKESELEALKNETLLPMFHHRAQYLAQEYYGLQNTYPHFYIELPPNPEAFFKMLHNMYISKDSTLIKPLAIQDELSVLALALNRIEKKEWRTRGTVSLKEMLQDTECRATQAWEQERKKMVVEHERIVENYEKVIAKCKEILEDHEKTIASYEKLTDFLGDTIEGYEKLVKDYEEDSKKTGLSEKIFKKKPTTQQIQIDSLAQSIPSASGNPALENPTISTQPVKKKHPKKKKQNHFYITRRRHP